LSRLEETSRTERGWGGRAEEWETGIPMEKRGEVVEKRIGSGE
jgi:hypothetical protein